MICVDKHVALFVFFFVASLDIKSTFSRCRRKSILSSSEDNFSNNERLSKPSVDDMEVKKTRVRKEKTPREREEKRRRRRRRTEQLTVCVCSVLRKIRKRRRRGTLGLNS